MKRDQMPKNKLIRTYMTPKSKGKFEDAINFYKGKGFKWPPWHPVKSPEYKKGDIVWVSYLYIRTGLALPEKGVSFKKLPIPTPKKVFPRNMMVSNDQKFWVKRMIYGKIKADSPYINVMNASTISGKVEKLFAFKYAKEI
jgi:hypothetical protein